MIAIRKLSIALVAACALSLGMAPSASADEASFIVSLGKRGVTSFTPGLALKIGQFYCQELRKGRQYNHVYSDILDSLGSMPRGPGEVGHLMGAAWNNLCPEFGPLAQNTELMYVPRNYRR